MPPPTIKSIRTQMRHWNVDFECMGPPWQTKRHGIQTMKSHAPRQCDVDRSWWWPVISQPVGY